MLHYVLVFRSTKGRLGENIITTKITLQNKKWFLHGNDDLKEFETLKDLKNSISPQMPWIPPSEYGITRYYAHFEFFV